MVEQNCYHQNKFQFQKGAMGKDFLNKISDQMKMLNYSIVPFLEKTTRINVYGEFFEFENFYYKDWDKQNIENTSGQCHQLSVILKNYLSELEIGSRRFIDFFDIYFGTNIYESHYFNWTYGNHVCLMIFKKGSTEKCWIVDPSLKILKRCHKEKNFNKDITHCDTVFVTRSDHKYIIPANIGSSIREELDVRGDTFTHFSASATSFIPLFIYENQSLILAKFLPKKRNVRVIYYEHKKASDFSKVTVISRDSKKFKALCKYSRVFSLIESLRKKVYVVPRSKLNKHQRLISSELEEKNMLVLYNIENAIVNYHRNVAPLTDEIVTNALKELINNYEDSSFQVDCVNYQNKELHEALVEQIHISLMQLQHDNRIKINALKQVLTSVKGFKKRDRSNTAYLQFVSGYFS
ncbi:hypothetical protein MHK_006458 [Candidatus Magnetomorum sp. HK-1]|nr:hypothetical protein MHK_006458 [Candidatus Magnetomorum sp. HK-1]